MRVTFDNIIFSLQKSGGISKVWSKIINYLLQNERLSLNFIENHPHKNIFGSTLTFSQKSKRKLLPLQIRKYLPVYLRGQQDIYHSSYYRPLLNKKNTKVVVTVHDFIYNKFEANGLKRTLHNSLIQRAIKQADAVICISENTKKDLKYYHPVPSSVDIYVVNNGVDEEFHRLPNRKNKFLMENIELETDKYVLYVGNRGYCKNFEFVISLLKTEAFEALNLKLVTIGGGEFSKTELEKIRGVKDLEKKLIQFNYLSNDNLNLLYNHSLALLFPSFYEGFGIPALEAAKAGCPVWASNSSSIPEILGPDYTYFSPDNFEEAEEIFKNILNSEFRNHLKELGVKRAGLFSWKRCAEETLEVYKRLLN